MRPYLKNTEYTKMAGGMAQVMSIEEGEEVQAKGIENIFNKIIEKNVQILIETIISKKELLG
jgi:Pyruvate/2-oxoacid:ferredoxin oxidoreductase gamma subunit